MTDAPIAALVDAVAGTVLAHADRLTALDQAIGDGDHGLNMKRGFEAVLADTRRDRRQAAARRAEERSAPRLVMKVGGASGPLYGTLAHGARQGARPADPSRADDRRPRFCASAIAAVKARGKSESPARRPCSTCWSRCTAACCRKPVPIVVAVAANGAAEATIPLKAIRGRAAFLGDQVDRSHGPRRAVESALLVAAIAGVLGGISDGG